MLSPYELLCKLAENLFNPSFFFIKTALLAEFMTVPALKNSSENSFTEIRLYRFEYCILSAIRAFSEYSGHEREWEIREKED